jgi:S-adenosylmethionine-diacylglycerol 3-amino-3-carboxypropyl transferase
MGKGYFKALNYTMGDEDNLPETMLLKPGSALLTIAGSGARLVPFLSQSPVRIDCFDIVREQLYLNQLRLELLKKLEVDEYASFLGYPAKIMTPDTRRKIFSDLNLDTDAKAFLQSSFENLKWESLLYQGRFEKMLRQLYQINRVITGKRGRGLFECTTLEEQHAYMKLHFPHRAWKTVLFLLGNSTVLNSILYKGDFPRKNIPGSTYTIYKHIFARLFAHIPVRTSFFLQLIFLGEIQYPEGNLIECNVEMYNNAKRRLEQTEVNFLNRDFRSAVSPAGGYHFVNLSDVPSFLPDTEATTILKDIKPILAKEAIVIFRGHMRVVHPDAAGLSLISKSADTLFEKERTQLWTHSLYQNE